MEQVRQEFTRTEVSSVEAFHRDEMTWILARFSMAWELLELLDDNLPQVRFASFEALVGYRFVVTGYRWASGVIELIEFEVITWDHPEIESS